jgi:flagellar motor protein MotB
MEELQQELAPETPGWAVFGDLMSALLGVFVLILVWVLGYQLELTQSLDEEIARRESAELQHESLRQALADPLAAGRITLRDGRIGISGSVLFALNSDELQPAGRELLRSLVRPLQAYLIEQGELLMVSGFTDNLALHDDNLHYEDNWELSAQRALTVTRALIAAGMPAALVFAAAFGEQQPVAANEDAAGRARNRRVEMAPVPRTGNDG